MKHGRKTVNLADRQATMEALKKLYGKCEEAKDDLNDKKEFTCQEESMTIKEK